MLHHIKYTLITATLCTLLISGRGSVDWRFKVKQEVMNWRTNGISTEVYTYDEQGRLVYDSVDNMGSTRTSYRGDTVFYRQVGTEAAGFYVLNSRGYATKNDKGEMWQYDKEGFPVAFSDLEGNTGRDVIVNGDKILSYGCSHSHCDSCWCYYYPQRDLTANLTPYMGRNSTHLLHYKVWRSSAGTDTMRYEYVFDKLGRVTSMTYHQHGKETARKDFSYME